MYKVEIPLGGKRETLHTSLRAAKAVNAAFGSCTDALQRLERFDLSAYVAIVAAALDKKPSDVDETVFATGMLDLVEPLSLFITSLTRGGRDPFAKASEGETSGE
jgi:hypothetical protein